MVHDGFRTKMTYALDPDLEVEEVEVKPFGVNGMEPIEQDSMWLVRWRIFRAQQILEATASSQIVKYDPQFKNTLIGLVNVEKSGSTAQVITETFYDGSTQAYYGFLLQVEFDNLVRGQKGRATLTNQPTNWDPVNRVEAGPVFVNVSGS
jgi:hypothetical protein